MDNAVAEQTGSAMAERAPTYELFVVCAAADAGFVRGYLVRALNLPPSRVLFVDELPPGGVMVAEIDRAVSRSRFTVAVLSPAYLADRWAVFGEQLASHLSVDDARIIPLQLADCELPLRLQARVALDFTDRERWETEAARLRDLLHAPAPSAEVIACPYPGMRAFSMGDFGRFFGRKQEVEDLVGRLDDGEREIYVIGPSGSGKSSLVQAGLLHVLEAGTSLLGQTFAARTMRPGERPAERLASVLEGDLAAPALAVSAFLSRHPPAERALVFVDQLEELFTLASVKERQHFIATLRVLRDQTACYFVLALRADFFGALIDSALWPGQACLSRLEVGPLRGGALAQAITAPAASVGVHIEAQLCDRLVADAAEEPGVLPLVQETLRLLWDKRRHRYLGLAEYQALGDGTRSGLAVALARRADATMRRFSDAQTAIARRIFLRLISFGEGRSDTRRQQPHSMLRAAGDDAADFAYVLQRLIEARLLTVDDGDAGGESRVDLGHEIMITAWPTLAEWIRTHRVDEQQRRQLEAAAADWVLHGRGARGLLDPPELADAERWHRTDSAQQLGPTAGVDELVAASRAAHTKQRSRRRAIFGTGGFLVVLALVVSVVALAARDQAKYAREQADGVKKQKRRVDELVAQSYMETGRQLVVDGRYQEAVPYLLEARQRGAESVPLRMLFWEAQRYLPLLPAMEHRGRVVGAAFSPDGTRLVTAGGDGTARVWDAATGKLLTSFLRHQNRVQSVAFSPDSRRVVTASEDGTARVWDAATGEPLTRPLEHQHLALGAAFSSDGTRVVTRDMVSVRIWDAATGQLLIGPLKHSRPLLSAAFSPDGTRVVAASGDTARVWDAATGKPLISPLEHQGEVRCAAFSTDGTRVVTASGDRTARVWDAATGKPLTVPLEHKGPVRCAAFSADGTRVVTASEDGTARVWDAVTGKPLTSPLEHRDIVVGAAFSADGRRVVTASHDKTARVWDTATGKPLGSPLMHQAEVSVAAFSPDGTRVVTASLDQTVRVWDVATGKLRARTMDHQGAVRTAAFSFDGTRVVTASYDKTARVWDAVTGQALTPPLEHQGNVNSAAFSPDGTRVVTASYDKTARVWDAVTGQPFTSSLEHQGSVNSAAFSPDGTRVVTASSDKTGQVWDAATGKPLGSPLEHQDALSRAAFSPDGTRAVTVSDKTARVWDAVTGRPLTRPLKHQGWVSSAAFSPDGTRLVTASYVEPARVWEVATGEPVTSLGGHLLPVQSAAFSPDGMRVVTASYDKTARVWDAATGKPLTSSLEHPWPVANAAFSPDGTRVVTTWANAVQVWDATTGKQLTRPLAHQADVASAAFSPDGTRVVTASDDKTARVWDIGIDTGTLADWKRIAQRSPFVLDEHGVLMLRSELRSQARPVTDPTAAGSARSPLPRTSSPPQSP